ncbi:hypothetical protein MMC08_006255 [Hypocenomyce scalaris]|nr:hypothetical protein [Hypocenomyce scalaris]
MAWLGFLPYMIVGLVCNKYGAGVHQWDVPLEHLPRFAQLANAQEIMYGPLIFVTKLSILLQYLRIFVPNNTGFIYYTVQFIIWFNLLFYTADTLVEIFECTPRSKIWNVTLSGHCVNINGAIITTAVINIVSDFSILLLPLTSIWALQMPTRRKVGVSLVFATGLFACTSSILRLYYSVKYRNTTDQTFNLVPEGLWTAAEVISGILCGCLPVLPQFFRYYGPKVTAKLSSIRGSKTQGTSTNLSGASTTLSPAAPWQEPYAATLLTGTYHELEEQECIEGNKTTVRGGTQPSSSETLGDDYRNTQESLDLENGIRKTVRIETSRGKGI